MNRIKEVFEKKGGLNKLGSQRNQNCGDILQAGVKDLPMESNNNHNKIKTSHYIGMANILKV